MPRPCAGGGEVAQTRRSVEIAVPFLRYRIGCGCQQQVTVVGHKQEEESVNESQDLSIVILFVQYARAQICPQSRVGRVGKESLAQMFYGSLYAIAQAVE